MQGKRALELVEAGEYNWGVDDIPHSNRVLYDLSEVPGGLTYLESEEVAP